MIDLGEETDVITCYDEVLSNLLAKYAIDKEPIEVSFRNIVNNLKPDRSTHLIHTYTAKLLMHIPHFFLNNEVFSKRGDIVLDPFCGSGTVMLEAVLAGRNAVGADANPLARLISKVKVRKYDFDALRKASDDLIEQIALCNSSKKPYVVNINYWFSPKIQEQLSTILYCIEKIQNLEHNEFFQVCFSNCVKKVSYADQRVSVPVKLNPDRYSTIHPLYVKSKRKLANLENVNVIARFKEIIDDNLNRFKSLDEFPIEPCSANIASEDARCLVQNLDNLPIRLPNNSISLIITSPPYAGAQKYIRSSSLSLGWLNLTDGQAALKKLDDQNIGRENYKKAAYSTLHYTNIPAADALLEKIFLINPLRAHIAANYLLEMKAAFAESVRVLKNGGHFILVVGNNRVCGFEFETQEYLRQILEGLGLNTVLRLIDDIQSYGLMTKRNKTANVITREWVLVFEK